MSWASRYARNRQRYQACRIPPGQWKSILFTTLKTILAAAAFMLGVGWVGICTGQSEVVTGARVGYWVIAAYGLGAVVRASLCRWRQFSRIYRESRAHNRLVLRRWHRLKSLGGR